MFDNLINSYDKLILLITGMYCNACKTAKQFLQNYNLDFIEINIDEEQVNLPIPVYAKPTLLFYKQGELKETIRGFSKKQYKEFIERYV